MNRTVAHSLFNRLRRQRRGVLAAVLPWLMAAWLTAGAAPCLATLAPIAASTAPHVGHDHAPLAQTHDTAAAVVGHVHCPHCPLAPTHSPGNSSAHTRCAMQETLGALDAPIKAPELLLKATPCSAPTLLPPAIPLAAAYVRSGAIARPPPNVPLNLRHCVFVI